jgi:hypothetical protein
MHLRGPRSKTPSPDDIRQMFSRKAGLPTETIRNYAIGQDTLSSEAYQALAQAAGGPQNLARQLLVLAL